MNFGTAKPEVTVEKNNFIRCNGESEVISNKCSGNIYRNNKINNTETGISLWYGSGKDYGPAYYTAVSHCIIENNIITVPNGYGIKIGDHKGFTRKMDNTGKHAMLDPVLRQIYPPLNNKFISNTITAEKGKHIIIDEAPDNIIENNILKEP